MMALSLVKRKPPKYTFLKFIYYILIYLWLYILMIVHVYKGITSLYSYVYF